MALDDIRRFIERARVPVGLWMKCPDCGSMLYRKDVEERRMVCPECSYHFPLTPQERIDLLSDPGAPREELWPGLAPVDVLEFEGVTSYRKKLAEAQETTGTWDAATIVRTQIGGRPAVLGITDSRFMMGSMGSVVGEKVARAFEFAREHRLPVVIVSGSGGGARMYEGCISLMQMAKTSAAVARFSDAGGLYVSILTNPTMAGVMASFAALGDVILAEPKALIGFTGPRVIQQTIKKELPPGFQTSEFMLEHGFIDRVVERARLRDEVVRLLHYLA
jgi:acetyl-CoA carboxylase carboxyl transferase subunit beta